MHSVTQTWSTEYETLKLATWAVTFKKFNQLSLPYIYNIANILTTYTYLEGHFSQAKTLSLPVLINI